MHASFFATLLLAASVVAPAFAGPIGIRGDSDLVARVKPLAVRDPGSSVHRSMDDGDPRPRANSRAAGGTSNY
ncbi:hypothetical protein V8E53_012289 [Lactarius tabidus]